MTSQTSYTLRVSSGVTESLLGRVFDGRYRVLSHIADGGMASVYLAIDTRLDRDVALKILRHDLAQDDAFVSRFKREARSAARLSHPNVVSVFDQGEDDGRMFLAMELVNGHTLRQVMQEPAVRQRVAELGGEPRAEGAQAFRDQLRADTASLGKVIREHKITLDQ
jgi:serine/threonine-protein kinase